MTWGEGLYIMNRFIRRFPESKQLRRMCKRLVRDWLSQPKSTETKWWIGKQIKEV